MSQSAKTTYEAARIVANTIAVGNLDVTTSTVGQATNATTAVDLPAACGIITTQAFTTVTSGSTTFAVNHESIAPGKIIFAQVHSYGGNGLPSVAVSGVNTTTANLVVRNSHRDAPLNATMGISYLIL
jgi:hypothetical protein